MIAAEIKKKIWPDYSEDIKSVLKEHSRSHDRDYQLIRICFYVVFVMIDFISGSFFLRSMSRVFVIESVVIYIIFLSFLVWVYLEIRKGRSRVWVSYLLFTVDVALIVSLAFYLNANNLFEGISSREYVIFIIFTLAFFNIVNMGKFNVLLTMYRIAVNIMATVAISIITQQTIIFISYSVVIVLFVGVFAIMQLFYIRENIVISCNYAKANEELSETLEQLKQTQYQLILSEKMASVGNLVAGVSHELNTPLGISLTAASEFSAQIRGVEQTVKENKLTKTGLDNFINEANTIALLIMRNIKRAVDLVQSLKQVSVDQMSDRTRKIRLYDYLNEIITSVSPRFKEKNIFVNVLGDKEYEITTYPGLFAQIITNLLINSYIHGFKDRNGGTINISFAVSRGILAIQYEDDGIGIPEENRTKIFDPFFTTDRQAGTGLGMHIVQNIVDQKLKGTIDLDTVPGDYTRFIITVPEEELSHK